MSQLRRMLMMAAGEKEIPNYLCFTALESGTFTFTCTAGMTTTQRNYIEYSIDEGVTWTHVDKVANEEMIVTTPTITTGNKVYWRGIGTNSANNNGWGQTALFSSTGKFDVSGVLSSLFYGKNFKETDVTKTSYYAARLFRLCLIVNAKDLILSPLKSTCSYYSTFENCKDLITAPKLNDTVLTGDCYRAMFYGCENLTKAPQLPAIALAADCYLSMFGMCKSLTATPELPATQLKSSCYSLMFSGCTSLTNIPLLLATSLANSCYNSMFSGCTSLTTANIDLPGQTLYLYCYLYMFSSCSNLTSTPRILATSLDQTYCCRSMFASCSKLTAVASMPNVTTISSTACTSMYEKCPLITTPIDFTNITVSSKQGYMFTRCGLTSIPGSHTLQHIGANMFSYNSALPTFVDFRNVLYSSSHFNTNTGIRRIFLPKFIAADGQYSFTTVTILDIGKNCTSLGTTNVFYGAVSTLILRSTTPPTLTSWRNTPTKVYVPADAVSTYLNESIYSSLNIYAIGGTEWLELFSSASNPTSEYADVELYVPSELLSIYISLYEE